MGRNTHARSHRFIPKRAKRPKPKYNWQGIVKENGHLAPKVQAAVLNGTLAITLCTWMVVLTL